MALKTFDPDQVVCSFSGVPIRGWAQDEILRVEQSEDSFNSIQGADGEVCRVKTNATYALATLRLLQSSDSNDVLSAIHTLDVNSPNGAGVAPFQVADLTGRTLIVAPEAWIVRPPPVVMATTAEVREWIIALANPVGLVGGN